MKLTIFGATGGVGRHALGQAVAAGHDVTAVVRHPNRVSAHVRIVTTDLGAADSGALESAVAGADAVLSGLGAASRSEVGIASHGTRTIVDAMKATNARRIVVISAAPVATTPSPGRPTPPKHDPGDGFFTRNLLSPVIKAILRRTYADLALMEDILRNSGLEWTAVRPPRLTNRSLTGTYRTARDRNLSRGLSIGRGDVAHLMLGVLEQPETVAHTVGIAY
jgi:putative NADH-flavin reductase